MKPQKRAPKGPWKRKKQKGDKISIVFPELFMFRSVFLRICSGLKLRRKFKPFPFTI